MPCTQLIIVLIYQVFSILLLLCDYCVQMRGGRRGRGRGRTRQRSVSPPAAGADSEERARPQLPSQLPAVVRRRSRSGRSAPPEVVGSSVEDLSTPTPPTLDRDDMLSAPSPSAQQSRPGVSTSSDAPMGGYWQTPAAWYPWSINAPHTMPPPQQQHGMPSQPPQPNPFAPNPFAYYPMAGLGPNLTPWQPQASPPAAVQQMLQPAPPSTPVLPAQRQQPPPVSPAQQQAPLTPALPAHQQQTQTGGERLDLHVSDALKAKIWQGKAIDMAEIFARDPRRRGIAELDYDSEDERPTKRKKHGLLNRADWLEAFSIYVFIICEREPNLAQGLMVHMSHILELQQGRYDWHTFDVTVRRLIEAGHLNWGARCTEEMLDARKRLEQKSAAKQGSSGTPTLKQAQADVPYGFCLSYHAFGGCDEGGCKKGYAHSCYRCKGPRPHRANRCPNKGGNRGFTQGGRGSQSTGQNPSTQSQGQNQRDQSFRGRGGQRK